MFFFVDERMLQRRALFDTTQNIWAELTHSGKKGGKKHVELPNSPLGKFPARCIGTRALHAAAAAGGVRAARGRAVRRVDFLAASTSCSRRRMEARGF